MSAFWIGQRVRITGANHHFEHVGCEATITSAPDTYAVCGRTYFGHWALIDGRPSWREDHFWHVSMGHMEPIAPSGLESNEKIDELFEPTPEAETVETVEPKEWHTFRSVLAEAMYVSDCGGFW